MRREKKNIYFPETTGEKEHELKPAAGRRRNFNAVLRFRQPPVGPLRHPGLIVVSGTWHAGRIRRRGANPVL